MDFKKTPTIPPTRITKRVLNTLAPEDKPYVQWDTEIAGFGVRVLPSGEKVFITQFRLGKGRAAKILKRRIATVGSISLDAARARAQEWRDAAAGGIDPVRAAQEHAERTFARLAEDYLERHAVNKRTAAEDRRKLERNLLPKLGRKKITDIKHRDIEDVHRALKRSPYEANRNIALLSKMFNLAIKWDWLEKNPATGIERYPEEPRERFMDHEEMTRLADGFDAYIREVAEKWPSGSYHRFEAESAINAIRLVALTGARKGEVLSATWDQFDIDDGVWTKPSAHTKQKREHRVPMSAPALVVLAKMRAAAADDAIFLFPSRRSKTGYLRDVKRVWKETVRLAQIKDLRPHDLRHTFASLLASSGASLPIIGRMLGHTQAQTTQRYAHLLDDPLRDAANKVGAAYSAAEEGGDGEVVQLHGGRKHD
jgi:integrase